MNNTDIVSFRENGYTVLNDFFNQKLKENLLEWTNELSEMEEVKNKYMKYYEDRDNVRLLSRMEYFLDYHEGFSNFEKKVIRPLVENIFGEEANLFKEKINFKLPGGGAFKHHQDHPAWDDFPSKDYINIAIPIDEMTEENGTLKFASGMGRNREIYHNSETNKIDQKNIDIWEWKSVYPKLGDLLIFDSYIPHFSENNNSNHPRRVYFFTYNKSGDGNYREDYFKTKREKFPPDIEKEKGKDYTLLGGKYNLGNPMNVKIN